MSDYNRPCCNNCKNHKITSFTLDGSVYCEVKNRRVDPNSLCQWHEKKSDRK